MTASDQSPANPYLDWLVRAARHVAKAGGFQQLDTIFDRWLEVAALPWKGADHPMIQLCAEATANLEDLWATLPAYGGLYSPGKPGALLGDLPHWEAGGVWWLPAQMIADATFQACNPLAEQATYQLAGLAIEALQAHGHTGAQELRGYIRGMLRIVAYRRALPTQVGVTSLDVAMGKWRRIPFAEAVFQAVRPIVEQLPAVPDVDDDISKFMHGRTTLIELMGRNTLAHEGVRF